MRLSNNEFLSLLKRAFEGVGWEDGRNEDAAFTLWWLEAHGINWLAQLPQLWPRLKQNAVSRPELVHENTQSSIIDAANSSVLLCGPNSVDLVFANACNESLATVETRRCIDRLLILPGLVTLAKRGANALARWNSGGVLHIATIGIGQRFPHYSQHRIPALRSDNSESLFLACSRQPDGLNHYYRNMSKLTATNPAIGSRSQAQFERDAIRARSTGINIDNETYLLLVSAADQLLVGAIDQPRQGAG